MFLQVDSRWANKTFYKNWTYANYGCFITALGNMVNLDPVTTAQKLIAGGGLVNGLVKSDIAAQILGLDYLGISATKPNFDCIAETLYYDKVPTPEKEQHFFNVFANGSFFDPLGKNIKYPIKSYRLFRAKGATMTNKEIIETLFTDPKTLIYAGKHDPDNRFAFRLLTGDFNYPGNKVKVLDDTFLTDKTINPEFILPQALLLKQTNENLNKQVNTLTEQLTGLDAKYKKQIDDLTRTNIDLNNKITELNTLIETLKNNSITDDNKKLLDALQIVKEYLKK